MMKRLKMLTFLLSFCLIGNAGNVNPIPPKHEVRAVWLTTIGGIDWPRSHNADTQQRQLCEILDQLKRAHVNTVLLQCRVRGTTIYPSSFEPFDACITGKAGGRPNYDPLQFAIDECHRRGMELHAWIVTIPMGKWKAAGCKNLLNRYPSMLKKIGDEGFMNPESSQTAPYLADICDDIARRYDVDGIHLDYIRYPETWNIRGSRHEARANITRIVRAIYNKVKTRKPWVKLSCSPIGKSEDLTRYSSNGWNAYARVCQDAQGWMRDGLMDQIYPMIYFKDNNFYPFAIDWAENACGRTVVAGLGIYFLSPSEGRWTLDDVTRQMYVSRQIGIGHAYFRSRFFTDNTKGIYTFAANDFDNFPALIPPMTWEHATPPETPVDLNVKQDNGKVNLMWGKSDYTLLYNVYAANTYPVNTDDPRNLIATRIQGNSITFPSNGKNTLRHFAITAIDRYGNESLALQSEQLMNDRSTKPQYLSNDGRLLQLPPKGYTLNADYVTIEDMKGKIIATRPYNSQYTDISRLKDGVYVLRSLNRKGITHRLGHFVIKRKAIP